MQKTGTDIPSRAAAFLYYGIRVFVALSAVGFLVEGEWLRALSALAVAFLMVLPGLVRQQYRLYMPIQFDFAISVFIFLTLFLGSLANFYEKYWWWDNMLHFLSGLLLGVVGFAVMYVLNNKRISKVYLTPLFAAFFSVCFSIMVSVLWEIYEFSADKIFGFHMQRDGINDTMLDLILNLAASLMVAGVAYVWMRRQNTVPFTPNRLSRYQYQGPATKK